MRKKAKKTDSGLITLDEETSQLLKRRAKFCHVSISALMHVIIGEHILKEYLQSDENGREELRRVIPEIVEAVDHTTEEERAARKRDES